MKSFSKADSFIETFAFIMEKNSVTDAKDTGFITNKIFFNYIYRIQCKNDQGYKNPKAYKIVFLNSKKSKIFKTDDVAVVFFAHKLAILLYGKCV